MKKLLLFTLLSTFVVPLANAQTDKAKHCPSLDQIKITSVQKPWTHYYSAYNDEGKYFISKEYTEDENNGPARPVIFLADRSTYDTASRKLNCVYYAYTRAANIFPTLVNFGDY